MDEIRKILIKARSKRRNLVPKVKAKAYAAEDQELSSEDNTFNFNKNKEAFSTSRKSFTVKWIADTGVSAHMTNQLHLFRGPLRKVKKRSVKVEGNTKLRIRRVEDAQI
jgi:hypothetical protein